MPLAVGHILQVKSFYEQEGNEALMVSFWEVGDITVMDSYAALAEGFQFEQQISFFVANVQINSSAAVRTVIDNLSNPPEYGEFVGEQLGLASGEAAPAFVALSIKQSVGTRLTRAGYKRIPFIGESVTSGNEATIPGGTRTALETWFGTSNTINFTNGLGDEVNIVVTPVVVGRTETPPDSGIYVIDLAKINYVTSAFVQGPTSQNSRKV